jgi:hypothetical protein
MGWREELKDRLRQADAIVGKHFSDIVIIRRSTRGRRTGELGDGFAATEPINADRGTGCQSAAGADVKAPRIASDKRLTVSYQDDDTKDGDCVPVESHRRRT